jgi:hypothetical protein
MGSILPCCLPWKQPGKAGGLQILRCKGIAAGNYSVTFDALTLKPSGSCNLGAMLPRRTCRSPEARWPAGLMRPFGHQPGEPKDKPGPGAACSHQTDAKRTRIRTKSPLKRRTFPTWSWGPPNTEVSLLYPDRIFNLNVIYDSYDYWQAGTSQWECLFTDYIGNQSKTIDTFTSHLIYINKS